MDEDKVLRMWFKVNNHNNRRELEEAYSKIQELLDYIEDNGERNRANQVSEYRKKLEDWWSEQMKNISEKDSGNDWPSVLRRTEKFDKLLTSKYKQLHRFANGIVNDMMEGEA